MRLVDDWSQFWESATLSVNGMCGHLCTMRAGALVGGYGRYGRYGGYGVRGNATGLKHVALSSVGARRVGVVRVVRAEPEEDKTASTVVDATDDEPVWVKREKQRELDAQNKELPFGLYLLFSCIVTIAAVGSIFEWSAKNPIFGVIQPDSILYTPILGLFAFTGIPTAAVLFFKGVAAANAEAERMDAQDGYSPRPNVLNPKKE